MKIIEIRDGFIKFEADKSIYLSSFIQVDGIEKSYIAQVNQFKSFGDISIACAKILFLLVNGQLQNYDKTEPSKDAEIKSFTLDILNNSITARRPVIVGKTPDNSGYVKIDLSAFNKKMLISVDDKKMHNVLISNFSKQFENLGIKTVVIDTLGVIGAKKFKAGTDFKLPLDTASLAFMYESCLNDATTDSKSIIVEIFKDLSEYSKMVPFVPFSSLKSIVDEMVDKQHVFKLFVLKNKLAKYEKLGYFASSQKEVDNLNKILAQPNVVIDLSGMDLLFQNRYLSYIYEKLNEYTKVQVLLETANTVSKKNLKYILSDSVIPTTLITHSRFQYLNDIKNMFDNFIIEPTITNNTVFQVYSTFLNSMKKDSYLTAGEAVNYIPIVSELQVIDEVIEYSEQDEALNTDDNVEDEIEENSELILEDEDIDTETGDGGEVIDISIDDIVEQSHSQEELLAAIDKKSDNIIESIAESIEESNDVELFADEEADEDVEQSPTLIEESEEIQEDFSESEEANTEDVSDLVSEGEEDTLSELETEEFKEEDLTSDLTEVNDASIDISEIPNEDMLIDDSENIENLQTEELSEEMLDESVDADTSNDEIALGYDDSEQMDNIEELDNDEVPLETDSEDASIELDGDVEELLETQDDLEEEIYPQNTTLDVDFSEPNVMPISGEALNHDFDEIVELDSAETTEDDIVVDMSSNDEQININDEREQEILEEVDKVYTTRKDDDELEEISDSDLDMIDELNNDGEELEEYSGEELEEISDSDNGIIEEVHSEPQSKKNDTDEILEHKESSTPIVPLYDADIPQEDMVMSDPIQQGDAVLHAKYGNGVVEKMIKYGNKTLFAINFENIGRRLLDPTLTEIKRV